MGRPDSAIKNRTYHDILWYTETVICVECESEAERAYKKTEIFRKETANEPPVRRERGMRFRGNDKIETTFGFVFVQKHGKRVITSNCPL